MIPTSTASYQVFRLPKYSRMQSSPLSGCDYELICGKVTAYDRNRGEAKAKHQPRFYGSCRLASKRMDDNFKTPVTYCMEMINDTYQVSDR